MDVVYIFKQPGSQDAAELRYSLRSLRNVNHDKVFIIGDMPAWCRNVQHIQLAQDGSRAENVARNLAAAAEHDAISEEFIIMNDDFFVMEPYAGIPALHWGTIVDVLAKFHTKYAVERQYMKEMRQAYDILRDLSITEPLSYELHVPMVLKKSNLQHMLDSYMGPISQFRSYYGNYFDIGGDYSVDCKVFAEPEHNDAQYEADPAGYLQAQPFLSATSASFEHGHIGEYMRAMFPEKSPYES